MQQPTSLHDHALQAERHLEQLATGLAQSGADQNTVQTVSKMADVARKIVSALGAGQEQTADHAPPAPVQPGAESDAPQHTMTSAANALGNDMHQAAQARRPY